MSSNEKGPIRMIIAGIFSLAITIITILAAIWAFTPENSSSNALSFYIEKHSAELKVNIVNASDLVALNDSSTKYIIYCKDVVEGTINYTFWRQYKIIDDVPFTPPSLN